MVGCGFGVPDIILHPNSVIVQPEKYLPKKTKKKKPYPSKDEQNLANISEVKRGKEGLFTKSVTSKMISQTITFSLCTSNLKNRKPDLANFDVTLIPSILLTPYHFCIFMYDYVNDGPNPLKIWADNFHYNRSTKLQI